MTGFQLSTLRDVRERLVQLFSTSKECLLSVTEDKAFGAGKSLSLGALRIFPDDSADGVRNALDGGAFEWKTPAAVEVRQKLATLCGVGDLSDARAAKQASKVDRCLDAVAGIAYRSGLLHPSFDPRTLELVPFRRSTTVVSDTSGVLQGALDFVARYLHPAARVKVPAIVQMEIVNFAERFLKLRRSTGKKPLDTVLEHLLSQGGQRVLLRLELHAATEVERSLLLGDPLRNAFQWDKDPDLSDLTLSISVPSYVDRLILEAARNHQAQSNWGHPVQLLTSDQGLARMALAEGMQPLYFRSVSAKDFFGQTLTGSLFHPFTGQPMSVGVGALLWEFATAFGRVSLETPDGKRHLSVSAIGEELAWSPYHSQSDLLWLSGTEELMDQPAPRPAPQPVTEVAALAKNADLVAPKKRKPSPPRSQDAKAVRDGPPLLRITPQRLFDLLEALDSSQMLGTSEALRALGDANPKTAEDYRRFLSSGDLVFVDAGFWRLTGAGTTLVIALRSEDQMAARTVLSAVPSFAAFLAEIERTPVGQLVNLKKFGRAVSGYKILAEVMLAGAEIAGVGFLPTPSTPPLEEFARIALTRFRELDGGEGLIATGAWLERLVLDDGIHPEVSRVKLNDSSARELIRRITEGSTTDRRLDTHTLNVLRSIRGRPSIEKVHLYRGDFLIPGTSSSSLRIESAVQ